MSKETLSELLLEDGITRLRLPTEGIAAGCRVLTLDGALPVQFLSPGDRIVTRTGARRLVSVSVTVLQSVRMIRVDAEAIGKDCPDAAVHLPPDQMILLRDWRAQAMLGKDEACIAVRKLVDGELIREDILPEVRIFSLHFDREEIIYADGLELLASPQPAMAARTVATA